MPIQVYLLGVEAYGFVGIITILQVLLGSLDLGISATITKVVSSDHSNQKQNSAATLNTASSIYWVIALVISCLLWVFSSKVASFWLSRTNLEPATVVLGIEVIAVYLGLRWPVAFYSGILGGLERMDVLNVIKASVVTLRLGGGVIVLILKPDLVAFLLWFVMSAAVELLTYAVITHKLVPILTLRPSFSISSFKHIWKYSVAMNLIAMTALILSQIDRLAVTKFLSLEALGYYSIAFNASIAISLVQSAINNASFPSFSNSFSSGQHAELQSRYDKVSQLMGLVVGLPCFALIFFGHDILKIWINARVADEAALTMAWLALGFFFNAIVSNAYMLAMACGQPNLPLKVSSFALVWYLPLIYWLVNDYGINGAAAAYAMLNIYYVVLFVPLVESRVLKRNLLGGMRRWLQSNLFPFALVGIVAFGSAKILVFTTQSVWLVALSLFLGSVVYVGASWTLLSVPLRFDLTKAIKKVIF
jgi:O-antigen/teichoic acid export membrane protein